ncbi:fumarylacetoacetate hydrolase family protein [Aurantimonas sp. A2-1-M11]|uniref:fumarylacetoacetate hydrolase family protein n=1 Tax=Aurantimonas sp. A2-1-M11 TaxID=3113712 RepID=UPI002F9230EA
MHLGLARHGNGPAGLVAQLASGRVANVAAAAAARTGELGDLATPKTLIAAGEAALDRVRGLLSQLSKEDTETHGAGGFVAEAEAFHFLPPIPDTGKFLCVGKNYHAHLDELSRNDLIREIPSEPTGFIKLNSVLSGHGDKVERPEGITTLDYEPELAFVIGKPAFHVGSPDAMSHVFGITLFNDLTAREVQKREVASGTRFWTAKNMPGFGPIGPWIVTMDAVQDVTDLWIGCSVNGEQRQRFNTRDQIHKFPDIIAHFSRYLPLEPGDIFATGAAAGTAFAQPNAADLYLRPGDVVEIEIEGLISLQTRIV